MNYYERHLGDYAKNASHLSLLEHGVYVRLLDVYYAQEAPIPAAKAARLIRAETPEALQALQDVLDEFFELRNGYWHQDRADDEIAAYIQGEPEREAKKTNEELRLQRHRQERADLFKIINSAGRHALWNISIHELRKLAAECVAGNDVNASATRTATATATLATATHSPLPTSHSPVLKDSDDLTVISARRTADQSPELDLGVVVPTKGKQEPPDCPHLAVLALWAEVMPDMPQHLPHEWKGTRSIHLRARWRETAVLKGWTDQGQGLMYLRKLFGFCRQSPFLSGKVPPTNGHRQFALELAWLVNPTNWAKVHEGKYHEEA